MKDNFRHNYIVNLLDGSFFWLGYSFISPGVILPLYVSHFTQNKLLIGLVAVISSMGYFFPQLFTANWVEQLAIKKDVPVKLGFFTERVPLLLLPFTVLLVDLSNNVALFLMLFIFAWHSFGAGTVAVAWNAMIAKVIPVKKRGMFMGLTTFIGTTTGILGAVLAASLLEQYDFPDGYLICFALAGGLILVSWVFLALTREDPDTIVKPPTSHHTYWKMLPQIIRRDPNFRAYLVSQTLINLGGMAWGFLAVYALERWQLSDGKVGSFTAAMLVGQAAANLVYGALADRRGFKLVLLISTVIAFLAAFLPLVIINPNWFYAVFVFRGMSMAGFFIAGMMVYEFSQAEVRPTYIGLNNTWIGLMALLSPMVGGLIAQHVGYVPLFTAACVFLLSGVFYLMAFVRDPRYYYGVESGERSREL